MLPLVDNKQFVFLLYKKLRDFHLLRDSKPLPLLGCSNILLIKTIGHLESIDSLLLQT